MHDLSSTRCRMFERDPNRQLFRCKSARPSYVLPGSQTISKYCQTSVQGPGQNCVLGEGAQGPARTNVGTGQTNRHIGHFGQHLLRRDLTCQCFAARMCLPMRLLSWPQGCITRPDVRTRSTRAVTMVNWVQLEERRHRATSEHILDSIECTCIRDHAGK